MLRQTVYLGLESHEFVAARTELTLSLSQIASPRTDLGLKLPAQEDQDDHRNNDREHEYDKHSYVLFHSAASPAAM